MQAANSADPAKYLPALAKSSLQGATGRIEFDEKGDRKDAEITIFTIKGGKLEPVAIVKGATTTKFEDFMKAAAATADAAKEAPKPAEPAGAPAADAKDADKKDADKK
jgi:branched-chain amino acid transport system substrate-binding protein